MSHPGLQAALDEMRAAGVGEQATAVFASYHGQLQAGHFGTIPEDSIEPLTDVPALDAVAASDEERREALSRTVVLKLNGGLGTSMGMSGPKSLVPVREGLTFLDIVVRQVQTLRERHGVDLPLLLMNSFSTRDVTLEALRAYPDLAVGDLPLDIMQNQVPKLTVDDLAPVSWPANPALEWCPPGHGDVYVSLMQSGVLDQLRDRGFEYLFLSNIDNLGAAADPDIAAWLRAHDVPYAAEVCERTHNDRKGGHLAVRKSDGRLVLRDNGAVVPGEMEFFQDTSVHTTFHTNNLWVSIERLHQQLTATRGVLGLPMIANHKTVDPTDKTSTPVIQVESAMGSAIEVFEGARAIRVPRHRFRPVKTTNELLLLGSDLYRLTDTFELASQIPGEEPFIDLGPHYAFIDDFAARFPKGAPSLVDCTMLRVRGDLTFGADVRCVGDVDVVADHPAVVPDGAVLAGAGADVIEETPMSLRSIEDHLAGILGTIRPTRVVQVGLSEALGLSLAEPIHAAVDLPGFTNSAMDGYAVLASDCAGASPSTPVSLPVSGDIAAGDTREIRLEPGTCWRIMTGAPLPAGADAVVPVEESDGGATRVSLRLAPEVGRHLRHEGEDVTRGMEILSAGTVLTPGRLALAAAANVPMVRVRNRPCVAVISTGDELREPGADLARGEIVDSNSLMLAALVQASGVDVIRLPRSRDDADAFRRVLAEAAAAADLVLTTGGVSMGAYDTVKEVLSGDGSVEFARVAMRPGMPQGFGVVGDPGTPIITLPGNPLSAMVSFHVFVLPAIAALQGREVNAGSWRAAAVPGRASRAWSAVPDKIEFTRVTLRRGVATPATGQGSHMVGALADANALAIVPADVTEVAEGDVLPCLRLVGTVPANAAHAEGTSV